MKPIHALVLGVLLLGSAPSRGETITVTVQGVVDYTWFFMPPISLVVPGDPATLSFSLTGAEIDGHVGVSRGYVIDPTTFSLTVGTHSFALSNSITRPPLFVLGDGDLSDAFMTSMEPGKLVRVALDFPGGLQALSLEWLARVPGDTLDSLDVDGAQGVYEFGAYEAYGVITDGPFDPMGIKFTTLTIQPE